MAGGALEKGATLVVASHNEGKVREIRELLAPFGVKTLSAAELSLDEPEETGLTFAANAELKARAAAQPPVLRPWPTIQVWRSMLLMVRRAFTLPAGPESHATSVSP